MGIFYATESEWLRNLIIKRLKELGGTKQLRILDVGGGKNSWLGDLVTDVIDIKPTEIANGISLHLGDVQSENTWSFPEKHFDFISCTHTLEDIRDPQRVVEFISKFGKSGFLSVPNRHTEVSLIEGLTWLGNYHHRWMFSVDSAGQFLATARWHYLNPLAQNPLLRSLARTAALPSKRLRAAVDQIFPKVIFNGYRKELVADYTKSEFPELGLLWNDDVELRYFNDDWSGLHPKDSAEIMSRFLSEEFFASSSPVSAMTKLLERS